MKVLVSAKLSPNKMITSSGYLVCNNAILAKTGKQEYLKSEIYSDCDDDTIIEVDRKPEQVFAEATLASFENVPLTCEHPDENVTPDNYKDYSVGYVRDVKKGKYNGQDVIIGTLIVTDPQCIDDILNGYRTELSCGYDCDITEGAHPQQINIRGNHVALCEQGRAGIAKIVDSKNRLIKDENLTVGAVYTDGVSNWQITKIDGDNVSITVNHKKGIIPKEAFVKMLNNFLKPVAELKIDSKKYLGSHMGHKIFKVSDSLYQTRDRGSYIIEADNLEELKQAIADSEAEFLKKNVNLTDENIEYHKGFKKKLAKVMRKELDNLSEERPILDDDEHEDQIKQELRTKQELRRQIIETEKDI